MIFSWPDIKKFLGASITEKNPGVNTMLVNQIFKHSFWLAGGHTANQ